MFYPLALPGQLLRSLLLFGGLWLLLVQDNGTGMSPAVQAKIFQPFFTTKPTGEGTGLGLSLSHDIIVQGHGGTLSVESRQGVGTEFTIFLPR